MKLYEVATPNTLFRVVPKQYLDSVLSNGLALSTGTSQWGGKEYDKPSVFLFGDMKCSFFHVVRIMTNTMLRPDEKTHEDWTKEDWSNAFNSLTIVAVDVQGIPVEHKGMQDEYEEWVAYEEIPAERVRHLDIDIEQHWLAAMREC